MMSDTRLKRFKPSYWLLIVHLLVVQQCLTNLHVDADAGPQVETLVSPNVDLNGDKTGAKVIDAKDDEFFQWAAEQAFASIQDGDVDLDLDSLSDENANDGSETKSSSGLRSLLSQAFNKVTGPPVEYLTLIQRFINWRNEYNKLQQRFGVNSETNKPYLRNALDVFRIEYSKLDKELSEEACGASQNEADKEGADAGQEKAKKQAENIDLITKVLKLLIGHLEKRLETLDREGLSAALNEEQLKADAEAEEEIARLESGVKVSSDKAKRIARKALVGVATNEAARVLMVILFGGLATAVAESGLLTSSIILTKLEPIIFLLLGPANAPLAAGYLASLKFSAVYKLLSYSSSSLFPCKIKPRPRLSTKDIPIATPIFPDAPPAQVSESPALEKVEDNGKAQSILLLHDSA